jgi:hypothetical protein
MLADAKNRVRLERPSTNAIDEEVRHVGARPVARTEAAPAKPTGAVDAVVDRLLISHSESSWR